MAHSSPPTPAPPIEFVVVETDELEIPDEELSAALELRLTVPVRAPSDADPDRLHAVADLWRRGSVVLIDLTVSDGRIYERSVVLGDDLVPARAVASALAALVRGASDGTMAPEHEAESAPWPDTIATPPRPIPALSLTEGGERPELPAEPEAPIPPPPRTRWGVGLSGSFGGAAAPAPPRSENAGASVHGHVGRRVAIALDARFAGWRRPRAVLGRVRLGGGVQLQPGDRPWSVPIRLLATVEPWWARGPGALERRPAPLLGFAAALDFARRVQDTVALTFGAETSISGAVVAGRWVAPRLVANDETLARLGGLELRVALGVLFSPR